MDEVLHRARFAGIGAAILGLALLITPLNLVGAVLLVVGCVIVGLAEPDLGLLGILVLFPAYPLLSKVVGTDLGVAGAALLIFSSWKEVLLAAVLVSQAGRLLARHPDWRGFRPHPVDCFGGALVVLVAFGLALGHNGLAANETRLMLFPIGVYVAVRLSNLTVRRFIEAAAVAAFGVAAFLIFQSSFLSTSFAAHYWGAPTFSVPATFIATGLTGARGAGTLASPNEAALAMAVWACMLAASLLVLRERMRWHALVLGVVLLALGLTFSRSAILATPVGLAFLAVGAARSIGFRQRQGIKLMVTAGVAVVAILVVVYAERGGIDLVRATFMSVTSTPAATTDSESPATPGVDSSTIAHANSLSYGWSVVQANPLGVGLGEVGYRVVPWTGERAKYVIESWYLTMGMSLGWAGFVWALLLPPVFFLLALAAIRRGRVLPGLALLGTSVAIGGICVLLPTMAEPQLAMLPWALAAFAVRPRSPASDDRLESGPIPAVAGAAQASTLS